MLKFSALGEGVHGKILKEKYRSTLDNQLKEAVLNYERFMSNVDKIEFWDDDNYSLSKSINLLVKELNLYRNAVIPTFDSRKNSGQENLHSTILEEFFHILVSPIVGKYTGKSNEALSSGKANSYCSLNFTPGSFSDLLENPSVNIHTKDQDFVLGCKVQITTKAFGDKSGHENVAQVVVPVVAIECKTYIERNMLDSCAGTAARLKAAMPYCIYLVAAEYMKMKDAFPELTSIDEVFILTKSSNSERLERRKLGYPVHDIYPELIMDIYQMVDKHLAKIWWSPEDAIKRGRVINRP